MTQYQFAEVLIRIYPRRAELSDICVDQTQLLQLFQLFNVGELSIPYAFYLRSALPFTVYDAEDLQIW